MVKLPKWLREKIRVKSTKFPADVIGLEIEVEGRNLPKAIFQNWTVHNDGSLRGEDNCEYVLREPQSRKNIEKSLDYLEELFKANAAVIDPESDRTSVHVHLNVQGKTWTELFTFWSLFTVIEDLSYELCGTERRGNLFCLRVKDCEGMIHSVVNSIERDETPFYNGEYRYAGCNMQSINKFGSIEFRGMHGTVDKREILDWIDFLICCLKASEKFDNPHEVVKRFSQVGPSSFMTGLPPTTVRKLKANPDYSKLLWEGMRLSQDIAWILPNWGVKPVVELKQKKSIDDDAMVNWEDAARVVMEPPPEPRQRVDRMANWAQAAAQNWAAPPPPIDFVAFPGPLPEARPRAEEGPLARRERERQVVQQAVGRAVRRRRQGF
jgi:hypothetical protein